jgi:uncharacterized SAM-binding protein YcdF (DUF218 family)
MMKNLKVRIASPIGAPFKIFFDFTILQSTPSTTLEPSDIGIGYMDKITAAKKLWAYLNINSTQLIGKADAILVLCSDDLRIANHACELLKTGASNKIIFSGKFNKRTARIYKTTEAKAFSDVALQLGVVKESILLEEHATNTQENLEYSFKLMDKNNWRRDKVILIQNPNMLRRALATAQKFYPDSHFIPSTHSVTLEQAPHEHLPLEHIFHEIVGDLKRIIIYGQRGMIAPQEIDPETLEAYEYLLNTGYTGNLVI